MGDAERRRYKPDAIGMRPRHKSLRRLAKEAIVGRVLDTTDRAKAVVANFRRPVGSVEDSRPLSLGESEIASVTDDELREAPPADEIGRIELSSLDNIPQQILFRRNPPKE